MWTYARCLPLSKQPGTKLLIKTISDTIDLAFVLMKSKGENKRNVGYKCAVSRVQVEWLVPPLDIILAQITGMQVIVVICMSVIFRIRTRRFPHLGTDT
jgi:hypothetical protein